MNDLEDKKISMLEIAKLSGVSIATVSRVLNNNGRYSPETEKKVLSIVEKYDYKINQSAKGLRTSKTQSIGVIVPDITNEFFAKIVRSIESNLVGSGYTVFVCDSNEDEKTEEKHIASLVAKNVEGIIYISVKSNVKKIYEKYHIPVVYIDRRPETTGVLISSDNEQGGYLATDELIKAGCSRILMLRDEKEHSTVRQRVSGYKKALYDNGIIFNNQLIKNVEISYKSAYDKTIEIVDSGVEFDGVFCNNDLIAIGVLHALRSKNIKVPDDVKLVGYDGVTLSEICDPQITTVAQNTEEFGKRSVEELFEIIESKGTHNKSFVIPVTILSRESTLKKE